MFLNIAISLIYIFRHIFSLLIFLNIYILNIFKFHKIYYILLCLRNHFQQKFKSLYHPFLQFECFYFKIRDFPYFFLTIPYTTCFFYYSSQISLSISNPYSNYFIG